MKIKISIFLLVFLVALAIWKLNILLIETVNVTSFAECASAEILNKEIKNLDKNWILIDSNSLKTKLITKFRCIKDINIEYQFPKTINITVYGRKFLAKVISTEAPLNLLDLESTVSSEAALVDWNIPSESSQDAFVVDETGLVFVNVKYDYPIPTIFLSDNINFGTKLDQQSFSSINQIFSKILTLDPILYQSNFKAKKYGDTLLINSSPKLAFSLEKDVLKQLASLQLILQKDKIDGRVVEFIDLRFDKPVVQYRANSGK